MNCHVSNQIAKHCKGELYESCYFCGVSLTEDDEVHEINVKFQGAQVVGACCVDGYYSEAR